MNLSTFLTQNKAEVVETISEHIMEQKRIGVTLTVSQIGAEIINLTDVYENNEGHKFLIDILVSAACDKAIVHNTNYSEIEEANIADRNRQKATYASRF